MLAALLSPTLDFGGDAEVDADVAEAAEGLLRGGDR